MRVDRRDGCPDATAFNSERLSHTRVFTDTAQHAVTTTMGRPGALTVARAAHVDPNGISRVRNRRPAAVMR
jgi:hypothetical protein